MDIDELSDKVAELERKVANMIRFGVVAEIDLPSKRVRVQSGNNTTGWIKWQAGRAGTTRKWSPPTMGEQATVLSASGEMTNAVAIPSIYSEEFDSPSTSGDLEVVEFPDGAVFSYDHAASALTITGIKSAFVDSSETITLKAGDQITLDATNEIILRAGIEVLVDTPQTVISKKAIIMGMLSFLSGMSGKGGSGGATVTIDGGIHATKKIVSDEDIVAILTSLLRHHHDEHDGPPTSEARA